MDPSGEAFVPDVYPDMYSNIYPGAYPNMDTGMSNPLASQQPSGFQTVTAANLQQLTTSYRQAVANMQPPSPAGLSPLQDWLAAVPQSPVSMLPENTSYPSFLLASPEHHQRVYHSMFQQAMQAVTQTPNPHGPTLSMPPPPSERPRQFPQRPVSQHSRLPSRQLIQPSPRSAPMSRHSAHPKTHRHLQPTRLRKSKPSHSKSEPASLAPSTSAVTPLARSNSDWGEPASFFFPFLTPREQREAHAAAAAAAAEHLTQVEHSPLPVRTLATAASRRGYQIKLSVSSEGTGNLRGRATRTKQTDLDGVSSGNNPIPYGREALVVALLNRRPFSDAVRSVAEACQNAYHTMAADAAKMSGDDEPLWQRIYLHIGGARYARAAAMQPQLMWYQQLDVRSLHEYVHNFGHIRSIHPIVSRQRLSGLVQSFCQRYLAQQQQYQGAQTAGDVAQMQIASAIELLVFALGSVCQAKCGGPVFEPGPEFYARARGILDMHSRETSEGVTTDTNEQEQYDRESSPFSQGTAVTVVPVVTPSLDLARAHLLAALFCAQLAWIPEAARHVRDASAVVLLLIRRRGLGSGSQQPKPRTDDERQLVLLYWTCVQLEYDISAEARQPASELLHYQPEMPDPEFDNEVGSDEGERTVQRNFIIQVHLRRHINRVFQSQNRDRAATSEARHTVAELQKHFEDTPSAPSCGLTARERIGYWECRVHELVPHLLEEQAQPNPTKLAELVHSFTEAVRAHHDARGLILPNALGAAMQQCRYLLLLFAASRMRPDVPVDDSELAQLISTTIASFEDVAAPHGILEAARRALVHLQNSLQVVPPAPPAPPALPALSAPAPLAPLAPPAAAVMPALVPLASARSRSRSRTPPALRVICPEPYIPQIGTPSEESTPATTTSFASITTPTTPWSAYSLPPAFATPLDSPTSAFMSSSPSFQPMASQFPSYPQHVLTAMPAPCPSPLGMPLQPASQPVFTKPPRFADVPGFIRCLGLDDLI